MATKKYILDESTRRNPFKVPEKYFENFTDNLMSQLPEREIREEKTITLWDKVKPWVYMAAMFAGIALMLKVFVGNPALNEQDGLLSHDQEATVPVSEIDEFYSYYEDQYANNLYRDAFLLEEYPSDMDDIE